MNFSSVSSVEQCVEEMRYADWVRARNRAEINALFNGSAPYTDDEMVQSAGRIVTNVNDLSATQMGMAARGQFGNALIQPNPLVDIELDHGPVWKRRKWQSSIAKHLNRIVKNKLPFSEEEKATFGQVVLHGVGPASWDKKYDWCPIERGIEDILVPGDTLRNLRNLPFFAVWRSWTVPELDRMCRGPKCDPGWNKPFVDRLMRWIDQEGMRLLGSTYPDLWMPEKWEERIKEGSAYMVDKVPTVDAWDFYFWSDEENTSGWKRRIILDRWSNPGTPMGAEKPDLTYDSTKYGLGNGDAKEFIYDSGDRNYAADISEIIHFQFGDCSAVFPAHYHSVRGMGFMVYAACHLQNRLKCKIYDAVFEALLPYLRVTNQDDANRPLKIVLEDKVVIPEGVDFVKAADRWTVNQALVQLGAAMLNQTIAQNSSAFTQKFDMHEENPNETATKTMAKLTSMDAMVGYVLNDAYGYQVSKYREIVRRFCLADSEDPDVRRFRLACFKDGVPEEALNVEAMDVKPVRVTGNGNRMMSLAIAEKLMSVVNRMAPEAQTETLRNYVAAVTNDYDLAARLTPDAPHVSDSRHDAQVLAGTLMAGLPVDPKDGVNPLESITALLQSMATVVQRIKQTGSMATQQEVMGLQNMGQYIGKLIQQLAADETQKSTVKKFSDVLGKLMNEVKGFMQRLQEQAKKPQAPPAPDPKDTAKAQAMLGLAKVKAKIQSDSHAQRTAEKQITTEQKLKLEAMKHQQQIAKEDVKTAAEIRRGGMKAFNGGGNGE